MVMDSLISKISLFTLENFARVKQILTRAYLSFLMDQYMKEGLKIHFFMGLVEDKIKKEIGNMLENFKMENPMEKVNKDN